MKRGLVWLGLPIMLFVGAGCRMGHPAANPETLAMRALMTKASSATISYSSRLTKPPFTRQTTTLSRSELARFRESFLLTTKPDGASLCEPQQGVLSIECQLPPDKRYPLRKKNDSRMLFSIAVAEREGQVSVYYPGYIPRGDNLASVTVNRWIELARANPRLGPTLEAGMK